MALAGPPIYFQGLASYQQKRVEIIRFQPTSAHVHVRGTSVYCVDFEMEGSELLFNCICPAFERADICKHVVAAGLLLRDHLNQYGKNIWKNRLSATLNQLKSAQRRPAGSSKSYYLFFSLQQNFGTWTLKPYRLFPETLPEGLLGEGEPASLSAVHEILEHNPWLGGRAKVLRSAILPEPCLNASPEGVALANLVIRTDQAPDYYFYNYTRPVTEYFPLLATAQAPTFVGTEQEPLKTSLIVYPKPASLLLEVKKNDDGILLQTLVELNGQTFSLAAEGTTVVSTNPMWVLAGNALFSIEESLAGEAARILFDTPTLTVPLEGETEFLENYLLDLANYIPIEGADLTWEDVEVQPVPRLYLSDNGGELLADLRFGYGEHEVPYLKTLPPKTVQRKRDGTWTLLRIHRASAEEEGRYQALSSAEFGLKRGRAPLEPGKFTLRARIDAVDFLMRKVPRLAAAGLEVYGEKNLKSARVNRATPTISLTITTGIDWFDVAAVVKFGETDVAMQEIRRALRRREQFVKLADGTIGEIPDEWLEKYKHLFGLSEQTAEGVRLSAHHITLLDQLMGEADRARADSEFQNKLRRLADFSGIASRPLPAGFVGELRPYQKAGYDWLHFLREYRFGGCLADDMGLGKTVQVLAFLQALYEENPALPASLIVVPRSLLVNWQREAARFTPGLTMSEHFGPERQKENQVFNGHNLIITTYGTMRRDIQVFRSYEFHYVILDESQAVKNPLAQVSKASRLLRGRHRLVMTGTPVENSTFELWAQFAFLNPGLLGNLEYFKREFSNPIQRQQDENAAATLRKMVYPFILRRTKDQVAPELPPRTERVIYSDMEKSQRKLYERTRDYYRGLVLGLLEEKGLDSTRMKILEGLLRLRQISNHPRLVDANFRGDSSKFELLLETLETLQAEGHKALVFSQFVQMLKIVRAALDERGIPYTYLDGSTQNRQERVDEFQTDPAIPFFLISLKAGGTGLNLTAAEYVIHIDPWWNPAVEMQASDRTHRIGQDKPVFIYKLITRGTVEEKILELQERKKDLVDQLITTDASFFKDLSADDVKVLFS